MLYTYYENYLQLVKKREIKKETDQQMMFLVLLPLEHDCAMYSIHKGVDEKWRFFDL